MGCFLGCFGSSRDKRRRKQSNRVLPRDQRHGIQKPVPQDAAAASLNQQDHSEKELIDSNPRCLQDKPEEKLGLSSRKKVTFDSNVKTYEHVSDIEIEDYTTENSTERDNTRDKKRVEKFPKSSQSHSSMSDDGSVISSSGSYPPNHRYQNCRDSDDEVEGWEEGDEESDLDEEEEEEEEEEDCNDFEDGPSMGLVNRVKTEEGSDSTIPAIHGPNQNVRDRSAYVHSVLNPVENVGQWKALKAAARKKEAAPLKQQQQKENFFTSNQEQPRFSFSLEPTFQDSSPFIFREKSDRPNSRTAANEIAVEASLSNWLESSSPASISKKSPPSVEFNSVTPASDKSRGSHSSNSAISFEDRPILGALTVEELRQFSASASPRRSPSQSPDEMPIIGTVGSYWVNKDETEDSGFVSSYKGIPNTTSKYREDKRVNWYSTPFETRLERALNRGDASCN